jgi:lysophospholipase L1-like esterase
VSYGDGTQLHLVLLGDSSAVGLGASGPSDTAGLRLLSRLAEEGQAATLDVVAVSGAIAADLDSQVTEALALGADVAVISIGANDVTHRVPPRKTARLLGAAVARLREAGVQVVVATAPDLGAVHRLGRPLRWWAAAASRRTWRAEERAVVTNGGEPVAVGRLLGPEFAHHPEMFAADGFHPSSAGYAAVADALWPSVLDATLRAIDSTLLGEFGLGET